jgi:hypothetical protein
MIAFSLRLNPNSGYLPFSTYYVGEVYLLSLNLTHTG